MNTFLKTFFVCLILTFGFLAYKFFSVYSYSDDLVVSKNNPVFGTHHNLPEAPSVEKPATKPVEPQKQNPDDTKQKNEISKYSHKCYFYSHNGELLLAERKLSMKPSLESALNVLLKGPLITETKKGIYSEIPANVDLISVTRIENDIIVDLTSNFGNGGGSKSITNRVNQLSKTVKLYEPNKKVYLYINGKEVEYLGGDGVYIKQPLD